MSMQLHRIEYFNDCPSLSREFIQFLDDIFRCDSDDLYITLDGLTEAYSNLSKETQEEFKEEYLKLRGYIHGLKDKELSALLY